MKKLYHPGIPCNENIVQKDLEKSLINFRNKRIEIVECNEGFGVFDKDWFWATKEELDSLKKCPDISIRYFLDNEKFNHEGWFFYNPIELGIELTRECNQLCIHCWNESSSRDTKMPLKKAKEIIQEFRKGGGQKIKISGGEPLSYSSLDEFLFFSKEVGIKKVDMTSNGVLMNREKAKFLSTHLTNICISIHGSKSDIHDDITYNKGSFVKSIKAIEHLQEEGLNPIINYTVMQKNKKDIADMIELGKILNVNGIKFSCLKKIGRARNLEVISKEEVNTLRNLIYTKSKELGIELEKSELYPAGYVQGISQSKFYGCNGLRTQLYISSEGNVYPCSLINESIGNIYQDSLFNLWRSKKAQEFRRLDNCIKNDCKIIRDCGRKCRASLK